MAAYSEALPRMIRAFSGSSRMMSKVVPSCWTAGFGSARGAGGGGGPGGLPARVAGLAVPYAVQVPRRGRAGGLPVELADPALDVLQRPGGGGHHEQGVHPGKGDEVDPGGLPPLRREIKGAKDRLQVVPHLLRVQELEREELDPRRPESVGGEKVDQAPVLFH